MLTVLLCLVCISAAPQTDVPKPSPEVQALLDQGTAAEKGYRWEEALHLYEAALANARERQNRAGEGTALHDIGSVYLNTSRPQQALEYLQQALSIRKAIGDRGGEGGTLTNIGVAYEDLGQSQQALETYQQALSIHRAVGNRLFEANTLGNIGLIYSNTGRPQQALDYYQQALSIFQAVGDKKGEANTLTSIGYVYSNLGQPPRALEYYQQALPLCQAIGDKWGEANTLTSIGILYGGTGQQQRALETFQQTLSIRKAIGDKAGVAAALTNIGITYEVLEQPQQALETYQQALSLHRAVGNRQDEAVTLTSIGSIYSSHLGQPRRALEFYAQALSLHRAVGNRHGEAHTLHSMGIAFLHLGQPQKALDYFQQALPIFQAIGYKKGEVSVLTSIGVVYGSIEQPQRALECYQQALPIFQAVGDKRGEGEMLDVIGLAYWGLNQPQQALETFQQALSLCKAIGDKRGEAIALTNIGYLYLSYLGQPQRAMETFQQALPLHREIGDRPLEADTLHGIGSVYSILGRSQQALETYGQALPIEQAVGARQLEAGTLGNMALVEKALHRLSHAEFHFTRAVALLETVRASLGGYTEAKTAFLAVHIPIYYAYLDFLLQRHKTTAAFALAQKTKARSLLDLLYDGKVDLSAALTAEERGQEQELQRQADSLNAEMVNEGVQNQPGAKRRYATLEGQLRVVEDRLQALTDTLYARHPDLAVKRAAATASLPDIARFLPENTALLEYIQVSDRKLALFVVTTRQHKARLDVYSIPIRGDTLAARCADFHAACADPHKDYRLLAGSLYRLLVLPARSVLAGKRRLIVCPEGPLWDVPFQALLFPSRTLRRKGSRDGGRLFLADRFEVAYAYSATGAQAAWKLRENRRQPPSGSLLVFANPDFGSAARFGELKEEPGLRPFDRPSRPFDRPSRPFDRPSRPFDHPSRPFDRPSRSVESPERLMAALVRGAGIAPLPGTQREAEALRGVFPDAAIYTGLQAQAETARQQAGRYRYLHFATHGFFNDAVPLLSAIVLARPPSGSPDNGFLTARDLFGLSLHADLVVLSACNTARGVSRSGEGIIGMTWALFVAGAPSQVVAQWSVDDASTAVLMQRFYRNLKVGQAKGRALQMAALALRRDGLHRHPYYWAPFILVGDWR